MNTYARAFLSGVGEAALHVAPFVALAWFLQWKMKSADGASLSPKQFWEVLLLLLLFHFGSRWGRK